MGSVIPIRGDLVAPDEPRKTSAARPRNPRLTPDQQRFQNVLNSLEMGADYVQAALAGRKESEAASRRALVAVDEETLAEWVRQTTVIYNAARQLRRQFRERSRA